MIYKNLFVLVSILIFLRPHFDFGPEVLSVYLADLAIVGLFFVSVIILKIKINVRDYKALHISLLLVFVLLLPVAVHSFNANSGVEVWLDYAKIVYFIMTFWFLYFLVIRIKNPQEIVTRIMNFTFVFIFIVSIIQLLDLPIIAGVVRMVYGSDKLRTLWGGYPRVFGTFYNANWFGVYLVFYLTWLNSKFIYREASIKEYVIKGLILTVLFIISGSRTAMIGALLAFFLQFLSRKHFKRVLLLATISIVVFLGMRYFANQIEYLDRTLNRFTDTIETFTSEAEMNSLLDPRRTRRWGDTWEEIRKSPLFGTGSLDFIPHNSYLYFLNMFGFIGAGLMISFGGGFLLINRRRTIQVENRWFFNRWKIGFIPAFLVMSLTAEFFFTSQVMLLVIFMYAASMFPIKVTNETSEGGII